MVIGWGRKVKALGVGPTLECPNCGNTNRWVTARSYRYLSVMFIPLLRWDSQYMMVCPVCERGVPLDSPNQATEMLQNQLEPLLLGQGPEVEQFKARSSDPDFLGYATSLNWPLVLNMQLVGHELMEAEALGIDEDEQPHWSSNIVAAVRHEIGELNLIRTLILETVGVEGDAPFEAAIERFFESSGYRTTRRRLFPELYGPHPEAARIGVDPHPSLIAEHLERATDALATARDEPTDAEKYQSAQLAALSYLGLCAPSERDRVNRLMSQLISDEEPAADPLGLGKLSQTIAAVANADNPARVATHAIQTFGQPPHQRD